MNYKNKIVSFILLLGVWILLDGKLQTENLVVGLSVAALISIVFGRKMTLFNDLKFTPKAMYSTIVYLLVFLVELFKSNIDVAKRVLSPSLPISPGIVKVKTRLKSKMGRLILANSITLTPGTYTIEITDEHLYIHWIDARDQDVQEATEKIVRKFEKYLEVIYG